MTSVVTSSRLFRILALEHVVEKSITVGPLARLAKASLLKVVASETFGGIQSLAGGIQRVNILIRSIL